MPSAARIEEIAAECFAEDVPFPEGAETWSEGDVAAYFESGGAVRPTGGTAATAPSVLLCTPAAQAQALSGPRTCSCRQFVRA